MKLMRKDNQIIRVLKIKDEKVNADYALNEIKDMFVSIFESMDNEYMRERGMDMDSILRKLGEEIKPSQLPQDIKTLKPAVHPSMYIHDIRIDETEEYKRLLKNHQNN